MSINLRPLPQIVAGIIAKPGYSEADFLFVATVLDRLGEEWVNVPKILTKEKFLEVRRAIAAVDVPDDFQITNVSTFAARTEAIADLLPAKVWDKLGLDKASWTTSLKRYRNLVAHSDAQKAAHREFMTGNGLPALRDATIVVVTLLMAQHMGVTDDALVFAAERQRYSWIQKYTNGTLTFTTKGLGAES
ncbi:hypothetical protein D9V34_03610 [Mycetocola lacteus]|uniref:Apea-like HEPN domain-containing protein n=2 Tax=Mycetocola lacteus TaxID=76637 RepID=A0A3L7AV85_9MICO|nr:hypothetical protein D9V34_03610 [Mycetocola lacteus]